MPFTGHMKTTLVAIAYGVLATCHGHAQTNSVVGTISAFKAETTEIEVKPDGGAPVAFKVTGDTVAQQVAPGVKDLKGAQSIRVTELHLGDRVLATTEGGTKELRRIVVMSATDLARRDEADRADWARRGVSGIVTAKTGSQLTLRTRTLTGDTQTVLTVDGKSVFRRYAPDSVRFADAKRSGLAEVAVGDNVRARGRKATDGSVEAEELVFGSFATRAGEIVSVNAAAKEVVIRDLVGGKQVTVQFTADSKIKRMLDRQAMAEMMHGSHAQEVPANGEHQMPPPMMSLNEMLDRLPEVKIADLQVKDLVVISSTRGAKAEQLTAISMLANAEMLLQVMAMQAGNGTPSTAAGLDALAGMGFGVMQ
jgi:hypothetical protein